MCRTLSSLFDHFRPPALQCWVGSEFINHKNQYIKVTLNESNAFRHFRKNFVQRQQLVNIRYGICIWIGTLATSALPFAVQAAENNFQPTEGNWSDPTSWTLGIPALGDTVYIDGHAIITGGEQAASESASLGFAPGRNGKVSVSGAGSVWDSTLQIAIGEHGTGHLEVIDGGKVTTQNLLLGFETGSSGTLTISGPGSESSSTYIYVGESGAGVMNIADGGKFTADYGEQGFQTGSSGTVTVSGAGSSLTTGDWTLGQYGTGVMNIGAAANQAAKQAGSINMDFIVIGGQSTGSGTLVFNHTDAAYAFAPRLSSGSGEATIQHLAGTTILTANSSRFLGRTDISGGTLRVESGLGGAITVKRGGTLSGTGSIGDIGGMGSSLSIESGGRHVPGEPTGSQAIYGDYTNHGTLVVAGTSATMGKLDVTGVIDITGATLELQLSPKDRAGWQPLTGPFTLIDNQGFDAIVGTFADVKYDLLFLTPTLNYAAGDDRNDLTVSFALKQVPVNPGGPTDPGGPTNPGGSTDPSGPTDPGTRPIKFSSVANTANQTVAADAIGSLDPNNAVWSAIATMSNADVARAAFDQLSGDSFASLKGALISDSHYIRNAGNTRLRGGRDELAEHGRLVWGSLVGGWVHRQAMATRPASPVSLAACWPVPMRKLGIGRSAS